MKSSQKKRLQSDLRISAILSIIITFIFALQIVPIPMGAGVTVLTMLVFMVLLVIFLILINPSLIQLVREQFELKPLYVLLFSSSLYLIFLIYATLLNKITIFDILSGFLYCILPLILIWFARNQSMSLKTMDILVLIILWFPINFRLVPQLTLPPVQGIVPLFNIIAVILLIIAFLVIRNLEDIGLVWRLKGDEIRISIQYFIIGLFIIIIIGFITGFFELSKRLPSTFEMLGMFMSIGFFIALPEELLFRGIIQNFIEKSFQRHRYNTWIALVISAIIFGLAHGNDAIGPVIDVNLRSFGIWHCPWAYMIVATIAGIFYGLTYIKTRKVTAAALVHLLVNWFWMVLFNG